MPKFKLYAIVFLLVVVGWAVTIAVVPTMSRGLRIAEDFSSIPAEFGEWTSHDRAKDLKTLNVLRTCSILDRDYTDQYGNLVNLSIVYGQELGDFHQPENCMEGVGWRRTSSRLIEVRPVSGSPFTAKAIVMTNDIHDIVTVYWFYMGGRVVNTMGTQKLKTLMHALVGGDMPPSAMIKFSTMVEVDEETAIERALALCQELAPSIIDMASREPKWEDYRKILE